jgi:hypothetical protein
VTEEEHYGVCVEAGNETFLCRHVRKWELWAFRNTQCVLMSVVTQFTFQVSEYREAQEIARKSHANMWMYGDITEDDAKEFGLGR